VDKNVLAAIIADDKAEALLRVEEFYDAFAFANNLSWHRRTTAACWRSAAKTAATAAAKTITAAATAAEAIATAKTTTEPVAGWWRVAVIAETITFVPAAPAPVTAPSFIETHVLSNFPESFFIALL
jgi:hypothetical protein